MGLQVSLLIRPEEAPQNPQRMCREAGAAAGESVGATAVISACASAGTGGSSAGFGSRPLFLSIPSRPGWQTYFSIL